MSDRERDRNGRFVDIEPEMDGTLTAKLDQLADQMADHALNAENTEVKLDVFKAVSKFWIDRAKLGKKAASDDGDSDGGLPAMRERLKAVGGGN